MSEQFQESSIIDSGHGLQSVFTLVLMQSCKTSALQSKRVNPDATNTVRGEG